MARFLKNAGQSKDWQGTKKTQGKPKKILLTNRTFIKAIKMKDYWEKFSDKHKVIIKPIDLKYSHKINFDLIINATSASITSNDSLSNKINSSTR